MAGAASNLRAVLKALDQEHSFVTAELAKLTSIRRKRISTITAALIRRGYAERIVRGCFRITPAGERALACTDRLTSGPNGPLTQKLRRPRHATQRDLFWRAMRIKQKFTPGDLLESAGAEHRSYHNALKYCLTLERAGYLRRLPRREAGTALTSNGFLRFQLLCDRGPGTPVYRPKHGDLYDPNLGEAISLAAIGQ